MASDGRPPLCEIGSIRLTLVSFTSPALGVQAASPIRVRRPARRRARAATPHSWYGEQTMRHREDYQALASGEVHVWYTPTARLRPAVLAAQRSLLSRDELE